MLSSERCKQLLLVLAIALMPLVAAGENAVVPSQPVEIHLEGEVNVAGEQIVLGDVATIYAKSMQDFKALSGLVISKIPDDKQEVRLPSSYLEARIRAALPEGMAFGLLAPGQIVFKLQRLGLSSQEFAAEIVRLARIGAKAPAGTELEVLPLSGIEQLKGFTLANSRIEPQGELEKWKGDLSFKVFKTSGEASASPTWIKARVRWFQKAWMAARMVSVSEVPQPTAFIETRIETTNLREEPVSASADELTSLFKGTRLRRGLAANSPLMPSQLERKPDAGPGSLLRVIFVSEAGVRVSAEASLVNAGSIGGDVKARLRSSKKIVTGKLVSQGVVEVAL